jgi:RNA polymerase sigma factor (sigma-70 family)
VSAAAEPIAPLVEHFFRHESGRLVAVLTRLFGWSHFDLVEDMVQETLLDALEAWRVRGVPDDPPAWMRRVARNKILDALRRGRIGERALLARAVESEVADVGLDEIFVDSAIEDSQLRMMFACCDPRLERADQVALTLKALCGFGHAEIARALLVGEDTVKKRLQRATKELVERGVVLEAPRDEELDLRLDAVHQSLYLLFNEGYSASRGERAIRIELCEEAARLCHLLCSQPRFATPATQALMALMLFHAARFDARVDGAGALLLIDEQDRSRWDQALIERAREFHDASARGRKVSTYHLQAGIAALHCAAKSYAQTDWHAILRLYDALIAIDPSPVVALNRAVVVAELEGPLEGIRAVEAIAGDRALRHYHLLDATLGELHRRAGEFERARTYFTAARAKTTSDFERELLDRRLASCEPSPEARSRSNE